MHELPLVFFTVFAQMGAGLVFVASCCYLFQHNEVSLVKIERVNIAALVIMAIGMIIASFHLGQPLRALNVIFGIGRSPMSNEIFTFGILFGITFISVLIAYFAKSNSSVKFSKPKELAKKINNIPLLKNLLAILLIIVSIFFVWTIVITYMLPTVKNWDTYYTATQMFTTMLILGGVVAVALGLLRFGMIISTIGIIVVFITKIPYVHFLSSSNLVEAQYELWILQSVLLCLSLLIIYLNTFKGRKSSFIYGVACLLALIGELMGRIAFYNLWEITM